MDKSGCRVCVTGGAGYIGSSLVKKLLDVGYTVHTTLRNLEDQSKVGLLKGFPGADKRLKLFQADIYKPEEFELAIKGCEYVLHVATPFVPSQGRELSSVIEATVAGARSIANACLRLGTIKRLIYTSSLTAASPLKSDGSGYKEVVDETCWTPLDRPLPHATEYLQNYAAAKTSAEKEMLSFCNDKGCGMEVVTLAVGLVGGEGLLPYTPEGVAVCISQVTHDDIRYGGLKFYEDLLGKLALVHVDDVRDAHIFCMEASSSMTGRFLLANSYVSIAEIASYWQQNYPEFQMKEDYFNDPKREIKWGSKRFAEKGFSYRYDLKMILDDSIACARKRGYPGLYSVV